MKQVASTMKLQMEGTAATTTTVTKISWSMAGLSATEC
jgi:hypothetical protein